TGAGRPVSEPDHARVPMRIAARDGEKRAGAELLELLLAEELVGQRISSRELLDHLAVSAHRQSVRRQHRQPAREIVAERLGAQAVERQPRLRVEHADLLELDRPRLLLCLERGQLERGRLHGRDDRRDGARASLLVETGGQHAELGRALAEAVGDELARPRQARERRGRIEQRGRDARRPRVAQPRESAVQTLRAGALDELVQLLALRQAGEQRARRLLRQHQGDMIERGELRFGIGSRRLRDFDGSEIGKIDHSGCLDPCWANPDHSAARRGTILDRARIVAGAPWEFTGKALNFRVSFDRGGVMASARPLPTFIAAADDVDPEETQEWLESIDSVLRVHGAERAHYLLECMIDHARRSGAYLPYKPNTAYLN